MTSKSSGEYLSREAKDRLVKGYSDEQLAENYRQASAYPDTEWARVLAAEVARRAGAKESQ